MSRGAPDIYVLAAEYSAPEGQAAPERVFRVEKRPGSLSGLLESAARRALSSAGLRADDVDHLFATTMPEVAPSDVSLGLYATRLRHDLRLERAQAHFEIGSSDAGASVLSSAVRSLRATQRPETTLVLAGQVIAEGGRDAIERISMVLDPEERALGLNMLGVGDMFMNELLAGWGLAGELETAPTRELAVQQLLDGLTEHKLRLASEYPSAARSSELPRGADPQVSRWLKRSHVAHPASGACAVVLSTDTERVRRWLDARNGAGRRLVRVLGVGEGEADLRLTARAEPLLVQRAVHEALWNVCADAGVNLDYLRAASFAVLHDAFPSIELSFLAALGFSPRAALERLATFWPNPYGGLTAFNHALAASGLVQIAKAFHVFTRPPAYVPPRRSSLHPSFETRPEPLHCLTTSVGGPMSHVVAVVLESLRAPAQTSASPRTRDLQREIVPSFVPGTRHSGSRARASEPQATLRWVAELARAYAAGLEAELPGRRAGLLEMQTDLDLRSMQLPLPAAFTADWRLPAAFAELADAWRAAAATGKDELRALARSWAQSRRRAPSEARELERGLWTALRAPAGLVRVNPGDQGPVRVLCLLAPAAVDAPPGTLVALSAHAPYPLAAPLGLSPGDARGALVPPWHRPGLEGLTDTPMVLADGVRAQLRELVPALLAEPPSAEQLEWVRNLAGVAVRATLEPLVTPPRSLVELVRELVLVPEPRGPRLAKLLAKLAGLPAPEVPQLSEVGFCELRAAPDPASLAALAGAIRRAEAWLSGAELSLARVDASFVVTVRAWQEGLAGLVRFGREAWRGAAESGVPVRVALGFGRAQALEELDRSAGAVGPLQESIRKVLAQDRFGPGGGIALLAQAETLADAAALFARAWSEAGGGVPSVRAATAWLEPELAYEIRG